jgi:hypothetical protein
LHETAEDLERLQKVLDESHAAGGGHLRSILQDERRLTAEDLPGLLTEVQVIVVSTVTSDCRPIAGPVDGLFYRGAFHFGTSAGSVRFNHLSRRPQVSAVHARGEELVIAVHGEVQPLDVAKGEHEGFRAYLLEVYPDWESWWGEAPPPYFRIEPRRMFAAHLPGA